jgi:hypothetical protein
LPAGENPRIFSDTCRVAPTARKPEISAIKYNCHPAVDPERQLARLTPGRFATIALADIDGDGVAELVVVTRSVGSGSYGAARAFSVTGENISQLADVEGVAPGLDPVEQLKD